MQGAAYVEFDVHLSKDAVPIVYHDLTCCISTKKVHLRLIIFDKGDLWGIYEVLKPLFIFWNYLLVVLL